MTKSHRSHPYMTTLTLFVMVCALAAFIILVDRRMPQIITGNGQPRQLLEIEPGRIDYISLQKDDLLVEMTLQQGIWTITNPVSARASIGRISHILTILENLPRLTAITENQRLTRAVTLADYGLEIPSTSIVLGAGGRRQKLDIGDLSPLRDSVYARLDYQSDIVVTSTNLLEAVPHTLEDLRDTRLTYGHPSGVRRLEIKHAHHQLIQISREGEEWIIRRPVTARADHRKVTQLLEQIYNLRIASFVSETMADPVAYGLSEDEAVLQLSLWQGTADHSLKIMFGKPTAGGNLLFSGTAGSSSVYAVPLADIETLPVSLPELRAARLYFMAPDKTAFIALEYGEQILQMRKSGDQWQIISPIHWPADNLAVNSLLHRLNSLRIEKFDDQTDLEKTGLESPGFIIKVAESPPETASPNNNSGIIPDLARNLRVLNIGSPQPDTGTVYARFDNDQQIFQLSAAAVAGISAAAADYRDLKVLAIDPRNIKMVNCATGDQSKTIERDSAGNWRCVKEEKSAAPPIHTVNRILNLAAGLRAARFERTPIADLALYGLKEPRASMTFTLTGAEGIRKTILIGQPADDEQGFFAMIQGQDGVFVINREIVDLGAELLAHR